MTPLTVILLLISITTAPSLGFLPEIAPRCQEQKTYKMLGYFCTNLQLEEIPRKMRSSIEVS